MKINVASTNQVKVDAVKDLVSEYEFLSGAEINSENVSSEISDQPKTLDETIQGAMNRARNAFKNCDLSFGIEAGLAKIPNTKSGYMNITVCAIYDGKEYHLGLSSGFEFPTEATHLVFKEGIEIDEAVYRLGITENQRIGRSEGMIGMLTKGKLDRKGYVQQAIITALLQLENKEFYNK